MKHGFCESYSEIIGVKLICIIDEMVGEGKARERERKRDELRRGRCEKSYQLPFWPKGFAPERRPL